jgi:hypothetical protein
VAPDARAIDREAVVHRAALLDRLLHEAFDETRRVPFGAVR